MKRSATLLQIILLIFLCTPKFGLAEHPSAWPTNIGTKTSFQSLGIAISTEADFPFNGTDIEKARYVFSRLPDIAKTYELKTGSGGIFSNLVIFTLREVGSDPENADSLKAYPHWGNCGEWSYAFSEILNGAGVTSNRVAFGDKSSSTGYSAAFNGTDTMVIVEETAPDGHVSRRVFDPFRAGYHSGINQPTDATVKKWGDLPLTNKDKWQNEQTPAWQSIIGKQYVKDAALQSVLPHTLRMLPNGKIQSPRAPIIANNTIAAQNNETSSTFKPGILEKPPVLTPTDSGSGTTPNQPPTSKQPPESNGPQNNIDANVTNVKNITFTVMVVDKQGKPVPNVSITLSGPASVSVVAPSGTATFNNALEGTYSIKLAAKDYVTVVQPLTVTQDMGGTINGVTGVTMLLEKAKVTNFNLVGSQWKVTFVPNGGKINDPVLYYITFLPAQSGTINATFYQPRHKEYTNVIYILGTQSGYDIDYKLYSHNQKGSWKNWSNWETKLTISPDGRMMTGVTIDYHPQNTTAVRIN